jgi:hypothetical protein
LQCVPPGVMQLISTANFKFDPATGPLSDYQLSQLVQQFLELVRVEPPSPGWLPNNPAITS